MASKKLRPGVHNIKVRGVDGRFHPRKVRVLQNGRWRFLKGGAKRGKGHKKAGHKSCGWHW